MSGHNEERARLSRLAKRITNAQDSCRRGTMRANDLVQALEMAQAELGRIRGATAAADAVMTDLTNRVNDLLRRASAASKDVRSVAIPGSAGSTSDAEMDHIESRQASANSTVSRLKTDLDGLLGQVSSASTANEAMARTKTTLLTVHSSLASREKELARWAPDDFVEIQQQVSALLAEIESMAEASGDALEARSLEAEERAKALAVHSAQVTEAVEKQLEAQQQRTYTLAGIRDVCSRLGFEEVDGPRYEGGDQAPASALILAVDTKGKGRISFRLGLDQTISTDSAIDHDYCAREFGKMSAELERAYGVQAAFTTVTEDGAPKPKVHNAEDLPDGASAGASKS